MKKTSRCGAIARSRAGAARLENAVDQDFTGVKSNDGEVVLNWAAMGLGCALAPMGCGAGDPRGQLKRIWPGGNRVCESHGAGVGAARNFQRVNSFIAHLKAEFGRNRRGDEAGCLPFSGIADMAGPAAGSTRLR